MAPDDFSPFARSTQDALAHDAHACPGPIREWIHSIEARLNDGHERMDRFEQALEENTRMTREGNELLAEIRDVVVSGKALFRVGAWLGRAVKWAGAVAMGVLGIWYAWKAMYGGQPPMGP